MAYSDKHIIDQLGQLLMVGIASTSLSNSEKKWLAEMNPAGVIYFKRNVASPAQLRQLSMDVYRLLPTAPLIGIDQEGGIVARIKEPLTVFPGNSHLGRCFVQTGSLEHAQKQAVAMAKELQTVGVNLNFTPVADVLTQPKNPVIGPRAFSDDADITARLVAATVRVYRKLQMASCAKHFPGHGDAMLDSHFDLPHVDTPLATMQKRELLPFIQAIAANVPMLMTAHVVYDAVDPHQPATLSKFWLQDMLRQKLGFKGVLVSDDLEMHAITKYQPSIEHAAIASISAGADMLLICKSAEVAQQVHAQIKRAYLQGSLSKTRVRQALARVRRMKKRYVQAEHWQSLMHKTETFVWPEHRKLAQTIKLLGETN